MNDITNGVPLLPYLQLAKGMKGKGLVAVLNKALDAPGVFVFSELLNQQQVKELEQAEENRPILKLVNVFAYGTYLDYLSEKARLPPLTALQNTKLKQLTIVTFARESKVLVYGDLLQKLEIANVRELEDLVIDGIYQNLFRGELDQRTQTLRISQTIGRDVAPDKVSQVLADLDSWANKTDRLLVGIQAQLVEASSQFSAHKHQREDFEKRVEMNKANLKAALEVDLMQGDQFGDRPRKGHSQPQKGSRRPVNH